MQKNAFLAQMFFFHLENEKWDELEILEGLYMYEVFGPNTFFAFMSFQHAEPLN